MKSKSAEKIKLTSYDALFGTEEKNVEGQYTTVPLHMLHSFQNHPFRVLDDEKCRRQWRASNSTECSNRGLCAPARMGMKW